MSSAVVRYPVAIGGNNGHCQARGSKHVHFSFAMLDEPVLLENTWSFWFDVYKGPGLTVEQYNESLREIGNFNSIQNFWKWYNNLPGPDKLSPRHSYHLMKTGIRPLWEDKHNVNGGNLSIKVPKDQTGYAWLQLLLACIGEQFACVLDEEDDICGLTLSIRKTESLICVWNKSTTRIDIKKLEERVKELLPKIKIQNCTYRVHKEEENFHPKITTATS